MTAADFSHETDPIAYHHERSWHFLALVDVEVTNGEMEEASNKLWGPPPMLSKQQRSGKAGVMAPMPCWKKPCFF